jgi:hypothetical protein
MPLHAAPTTSLHESGPLSEDSQQLIPESFMALYLSPGRSKPTSARTEITQRHDFCDDLAQMLTETARNTQWELQVDEAEILSRVHLGLLAGEQPVVSPAEASWVVCRLAELLGWPLPPFDPRANDPHPPDGS